jgi:hypothetical protein
MTETKQTEKERTHRNEHFGELYLLGKILYTDHKDRMLSLLHAILNSVSSTLAITMAAGACKQGPAGENERSARSVYLLLQVSGQAGRPRKKACRK